jgi:peptide/nickel transport system substrate-binding protein
MPEPKSYEALGDKFGVTEAIGTGPYKMQQFTVGQQTVLVRNDDYKSASALSKNQGPAKFKKLTFREIGEESTAYLELKTGGADVLVNVPTDFLPRIQADKAVKLVTIPGNEVSTCRSTPASSRSPTSRCARRPPSPSTRRKS